MAKKKPQKCPNCGTDINEITYINVLIDESGSMDSQRDETIQGFNSYISKLQEEGVNGKVTLTQFNSAKGAKISYSGRILDSVPKLTNSDYVPDAMTPLLDAVGRTISRTDEFNSNKVIMIIITDGLENASQEYSNSIIREMIESRQGKGWTFVYLGANQDAWSAGSALGIRMDTISYYEPIHTNAVYVAAAGMTCNYATSRKLGATAADFYNDAVKNSQ